MDQTNESSDQEMEEIRQANPVGFQNTPSGPGIESPTSDQIKGESDQIKAESDQESAQSQALPELKSPAPSKNKSWQSKSTLRSRAQVNPFVK